jgi:hypothetical protein
MWKLTLGHGNWKYMISSESPGKADSALLSHLFFQGDFSLCFVHWRQTQGKFLKIFSKVG